MTSRLYWTAELTSARLNVAVPLWRDDAAWKRAARTRGPPGRPLATSGLSRSNTRIRRTSTKFRINGIPRGSRPAGLGIVECSSSVDR